MTIIVRSWFLGSPRVGRLRSNRCLLWVTSASSLLYLFVWEFFIQRIVYMSHQKYKRLRCLLHVKSLVHCCINCPQILREKTSSENSQGIALRIQWYFFSSRLDGITKYFCRHYLQDLNALIF